MEFSEFMQIAAVAVALVTLAVPLGRYMANVYEAEAHVLKRPLSWLESATYKLGGVNPTAEMNWRQYAFALLIFNFLGFLLLMFLLLTQGELPLNPANLPSVPFWLALNSAVSFVTNTNWQAYSGESTMSQLTQMAGLGVQNFVSAATGWPLLWLLPAELHANHRLRLAIFWADLTRSLVYILMPLSLIMAVVLVSQGVVQNFSANVVTQTIEGAEQVLPMGPAASQVAIKQLGTNGGGFFGVNSAHPFENPTPFSNILQILAILLIPFATPIMFGRLIGSKRHGHALLAAMITIFVVFLGTALWSEISSHPIASVGPAMEERRPGSEWSAVFCGRSPRVRPRMVRSMRCIAP